MLKTISSFIRRCAKSRIGQSLFLIHFLLFVYAIGYWHSRPFEFESSHFSKLFDLLRILDTPTLYPLILIARNRLNPTQFNETIISAIVSLQWWVVGYLIESSIHRIRRRGAS
jgi:hypothetical protein